MLGIDPLAPQGDLFRRVRLEDLEDDEGGFDAVVAVRSLHPIRDLAHGLDRVAALLRPGAPLVVDEIGWDLMDEPTLDWLYGQRRALAAAGHGDAPASLDELREEWESSHLGIHGYDALRRELESRFEERAFVRTPFLHRLLARRCDRGARAGADRRRGHTATGFPLGRRRPPSLNGGSGVTRSGDGSQA